MTAAALKAQVTRKASAVRLPADHPFAEATTAAEALLLAKPVVKRTAANRRDLKRVASKARRIEVQP